MITRLKGTGDGPLEMDWLEEVRLKLGLGTHSQLSIKA